MQARKRILLVTEDAAELDRAKNWEAALGGQWEIFWADLGERALEMMASGPFEVVLAELLMKGSSGIDFLNEVWRSYPKTVRFLLAQEADQSLVTPGVLSSHQVLLTPIPIDVWRDSLERVGALFDLFSGPQFSELVSRLPSLPCLPPLYFELLRQIAAPSATPQSIGAVITKDPAITARLMQVVNAADFGLRRRISGPAEAVQQLGAEIIRALVLGIYAFAMGDELRPEYLSVAQLWHHSLAVAGTARKTMLRLSGEGPMADAAYTAGLLHDVGKLILAAHFHAPYGNALARAKIQKVDASEIEREVLGANHAEMGAYLLSTWGLPTPVVQATAFHHSPATAVNPVLSALTAVHVANVLEHERNPADDGTVAPQLDSSYLAGLDIADRLSELRSKVLGAGMPTPPNAPGEPEPPPTATAADPELPGTRPAWFKALAPLGALAAVGILLLGLWKLFDHPVRPVKAAPLKPQTATTAPKPNAPILQPQASLTVPPAARPAPPTNPPAPIVAIVAPAPQTNTAPPAPPRNPELSPFFGLKIQAVLFSDTNPLVVINGRTLRSGESIKSVRVIEIRRDEVVLESGDERKVCFVGALNDIAPSPGARRTRTPGRP